jgi:hypothetical protein
MTSRNTRLALLSLAILVVGVVLYVVAGRSSKPAAKPDAQPVAGNKLTVDRRGTPPPTGTDRPSATPAANPPVPGSDPANDPANPGTKTYVMEDGTVVRDHRKDGAPPVATTPLPPEQRTMNPDLTAVVYREVAPRVAACAAQVPADARGADPFVYVNLTVEVDGGTLSSSSVVPVAHDVEESAAGPLVACVRESLGTLRVEAKGEPDQASYVLQYPVKLR